MNTRRKPRISYARSLLLWELDHIKPYKAGGHFIASNLRLLCQLCNIRKGSHWEGN